MANGWNGTFPGTSGAVSVANMPYNGSLAAGGSTQFGFQGNGSPAGVTVTCATS